MSNTVEGSVGGWYLMSGDAENGSVTAENKTKIINGNIFGGYTHDGNASGNTAALTGTWVKGGPDGDYSTGAVFGGYTDRGSAKGNTLTINEYSTIDFQAVGGQTYDGSADNNEVCIDKSFIGRDPRDLSEEEVAQAPDAVNGGSGDSASVNKVEMTDSMSWGRVTGGAAFTGEANVNRVTISGGHVVSVAGAASVMGGLSNGGDVRENHVTIQNGQKGAEVEYSVMGGYTLRGDAAGNTVTVSDETLRDEEGTRVHGGLYGGLTEWGNADGNSVTVTNVILDGKNLTDVGNGTDAIYGGRTENGNASGNTVTVENSVVYDRVYGGWAAGGNVEKNAVELAGETGAADTIVGGFSEDGAANGNQVTALAGAELGIATVYGGYGASAEGNSILLNKGSDTELTVSHVYHMIGGYATDGDASGNGVWIENSGVSVYGRPASGYDPTSYLAGGYAVGGTADGNWLVIVSSTIEKTLAEGETNANLLIAGGWGQTGANDNWVLLGDADGSGSRSTVTGNDIYGGLTESGSALDNDVIISGGTTEAVRVYGGRSKEGDVSWNWVSMISGTVDAPLLYGGLTESGSALNNGVAIYGGTTVTMRIIGGETKNGDADENRVLIMGDETKPYLDIIGGVTESGSVSDNQVTVVGEKVTTLALYGGRLKGDVAGAGIGDGGAAVGNTVTLFGDANVEEAALYGWKLTDEKGGAPAKTADNDLIIDDWTGATQSVKHFDTIRFQGVAWDPGGTLLTITNGAEGDLENTRIDAGNVVILGGRTPQVGESMTFVTSGNVDTGLSEEQAAGGFTQGVVTAGTAEWDMPEAGKTLNYKITGVFRNAQTDAVAENRLAGAAFVNQGADIAADSLHLLDDGYHWGTRTFGAVYGNRSTYDAAGDFKINGWSTIVGAGNVHEVKGGRLAWGVFYENGTGNYRTWNEFNNEMFRGDGSLLYNGGGAAVRLTKDSGMYYEASLRAGTLSSSMTDAVRDGYGNSYGFDSDSTYWGGHIGAGKLIESGRGEWDIYGKYFHTEIDGDSFAMGGDAFSFDSVTSDRLRLGARYTAEKGRAWSLYYGAAYEYEFSGDSRMKARPWDTEQSLQGSTVFGETGAVMREGFSGMVMAAYSF